MRAIRVADLVSLAIIALLGCAEDPAPDGSTLPRLDVGETVTLQFAAADTEFRFVFHGVADSVYAATVVPLSGGVYLGAFDSASGTPISATTFISTNSPELERTTPLLLVPSTGAYVFRVLPAVGAGAASLKLTLHEVGVAPEHTDGSVTIGTTVSAEDLGDASDLDRFTFTGVAGAWIEPELLVDGAVDLTRTACLTLIAPDGTRLQSTVAFTGDSAVFDPQGGRLQLPSSGTYRVEVASARSRCAGFTNFPFTGSYRFTLHPIDTRPESVPQAISIGDTVVGEAIDQVGDVDRFRLVGTPGAMTLIYPHRTLTGPRGLLRFRADGQPGYLGQDHYLGSASDTGLTSTPGDVYTIPDSGVLTVQISGWRDGPGGDTGSYTLYFDPIDPAPEVHASAISIGDTVSDEAIDKLGDIDLFTFHGTPGQQVNVAFRMVAGPGTGALILAVVGPDGQLQGEGTKWVSRGTADPDGYTGVFTIASTGTYTVQVSSAHTHLPENVGAYRFQVFAVPPSP